MTDSKVVHRVPATGSSASAEDTEKAGATTNVRADFDDIMSPKSQTTQFIPRAHAVSAAHEERMTDHYDLVRAELRSLRQYHRSTWVFCVIMMSVLFVVICAFMYFHETPAPLYMRKVLFGLVFMPFYAIAYIVVAVTRERYELNDAAIKGSFYLLGFASAYILLSLFNSVLLTLEMS